ncbi:CG0192-related protein [Actinopolymorpha singaporensis]
MAVIHRAEIRPTKLELLGDWLPKQTWFAGAGAPGEKPASVGAYRFDDPRGEVGIETLLVRTADGQVVQVPLTYRGAPLAGGEPFLVGTMDHSVLGRRWVYDGCGDPVYLSALAAVVLGHAVQAEELVEGSGADGPQRRTPTVSVVGTGTRGATPPVVEAVEDANAVGEQGDAGGSGRTVVRIPGLELTIFRLVDLPGGDTGDTDRTDGDDQGGALLGAWTDQTRPVRLATARRI